MSEKLGEAILELKTGDKDFSRGIDAAERKAKRLGRTLDNVGKKAMQLGRSLTAFVTVPLVALGVAAVKTASDVQEMQNLFAVTFGDAADNVEQWATVTASALNRSRFELMRTAADFAAFLKPLGVAPDAIAPMSKALTQLTTDIASFRNLTEEETFTRLFSGLAGETEAVRRLGIDIGEAAIEAELLRQGFKGNATEATQAQKVMARFSLIMQQTSDAQGDAARTAGSFENQVRGLGATIKDLAVAAGARLLPVAQRLVGSLRELGQRFLRLSENTQTAILSMVAFVGVVGPVLVVTGVLIRAMGLIVTAVALLPKAFRFAAKGIAAVLVGIQMAVVAFLAFFSTIPGIIVTTLAAVIGSLIIFKDTIIGFFKGLVTAIKNELVAGFNNRVVIPFQNAVNALAARLEDTLLWSKLIKPMEVNDVIDNDFGKEFGQVMRDAAESGKQEIEDFKQFAAPAIDFVKDKIEGLAGAIVDFIPNVSDLSLDKLGGEVNGLLAMLDALNQQIANVGTGAQAAGTAGVAAFNEFGTSIRNSVEDNLTQALTSVKSFGDAARAILNTVIEALVRTRLVQPFLAALSIPGFAAGGRPPVGQPYVVGERGPELRIDDRPGTIIPNHELGGTGGGMTQNFHFPFATPPQLEAMIRNVAGPAGRAEAVAVLNAQRGRL